MKVQQKFTSVRSKKNKLEVFRDVGVAEMVDKEINKVVEEVNIV